MMMRLKQVYSSLCPHKAANCIFSFPNTPASSKLRCFSSNADSFKDNPWLPKSRFENPYIDRNGYPTLVSLEQLEEFMKKYPVLVSVEDLKKSPPNYYHIPHPNLVNMFIAVPGAEITFPYLSGSEGIEIVINPGYDDVCYVTSDEEALDNDGWSDGDDFVIPEGWPKDIDYKNLRPKSYGDPPVISEEVDAIIYPQMTNFPAFWEFCEEERKKEQERKPKQNHEKKCVPDPEEAWPNANGSLKLMSKHTYTDELLFDGCDYKHWLVVMEEPQGEPTRDEIIDSYVKTLSQVLGSEEEARMKIYSVSTKHFFAFGALFSEELRYQINELPGVHGIFADYYVDIEKKIYGGEPFINGKAVPYDPKYNEEQIRNRESIQRGYVPKSTWL